MVNLNNCHVIWIIWTWNLPFSHKNAGLGSPTLRHCPLLISSGLQGRTLTGLYEHDDRKAQHGGIFNDRLARERAREEHTETAAVGQLDAAPESGEDCGKKNTA